jgi:hypothetical protein
MKFIISAFLLSLILACTQKEAHVEKELTFEELIELDATNNIKGFSNQNIDSLSLMLLSYPIPNAFDISSFIQSQTQIAPLIVISNVEFLARKKFGLRTDESKKIFKNTKTIVDTLIKQKNPKMYFTSGGTRNSFKAYIDTLDNFNFHSRSGFGVSHYHGKCQQNETGYTFLPDPDCKGFKYCKLKSDTLFNCKSKQYHIVDKKSW